MPTIVVPKNGRPIIRVAIGIGERQGTSLKAQNKVVPRPIWTSALLDTGADFCAIDRTLIAKLKLERTEEVEILTQTSGAGGAKRHSHWGALLLDTNPIYMFPFQVAFVDADFGTFGYEVFLGRNVLDQWVVQYDGPGKRLSVTYDEIE